MRIFIAGSRKFYNDIERAVSLFEDKGIKATTAGKSEDQDTFESEKSALFRAFKEIDEADVLFVIAKDGYIGTTVGIEIAYAFSKNKEIFIIIQ